MKNPFASPKKTGRTDQNPTGDNIAGVDHLEYGGHLPNSTSYDSALEVMAYSGPHDVKDPYASQHIDTNFSRTGSPRVSRANTREDPDRLDPADAVDALPADDGDKPEDTNLFRMMIADMKALVRVYKAMSWKECFKTLTQRYLWKWYALLVVVIVVTVLLSSNHDTIVEFMRPAGAKIRSWPGGWLIPIVVLIVLSFPPLVGHEVVGILIGVLWGLHIGFWILAAGTFLGELATWFVFRTLCTTRADKFEKKNKYYSALTQLIREKSFLFVLVLRFSAIPGHVTTALSSSAGANFWSYCAAAILTLPKQLSLVYVGTAFNSKNATTHAVSVFTLMLTIVGTGIAAVYIYYQMRIYLLKKEKYNRAVQMEMEGRGDNPEMTMVPGSTRTSVGGRRSLDGEAITSSLDMPYTDEPCPTTAYRQVQTQKNVRRPFLHSNSSYGVLSGSHTPSRSKSLHEQDGQNISEYLKSKRQSQLHHDRAPESGYNTPDVVISSAMGEGPVQRDDSMERPPNDTSGFHLDVAQSIEDIKKTRRRSDTNASSASRASEMLLQQYEEIVQAGEIVRGTASLDLWRPEHMSLHQSGKDRTRSPPPSGRDIARDADTFAAMHGARRPDLGRSRGESSAALLGRPPMDDQ